MGTVHTDRLNGIGADLLKVGRGACRQIAQIKAGQQLAFPIRACADLEGGLIAIIEHLVRLDGGGIEPCIAFRANLQAKRTRD